MAPDRITPRPPLIETLRALARKRTQDTGINNQTNLGTRNDSTISEPVKHDPQALRKRLKDFAMNVDVADEISMMQARGNVVREILLWEFGTDFRTDAQFVPMVDAISATLNADPQYQQRFIDLINDLRKA
jgi:hypothetical protein